MIAKKDILQAAFLRACSRISSAQVERAVLASLLEKCYSIT